MPVSTANSRCAATNVRGKQCGGKHLHGDIFCWAHSPDVAARRTAARRAGGQARHGRQIGSVGEALQPIDLVSIEGCRMFVHFAAKDLSKCEPSVDRAKGWLRCAEVAIKVVEA